MVYKYHFSISTSGYAVVVHFGDITRLFATRESLGNMWMALIQVQTTLY